MAIKQEMFRFVSTRRAERVLMARIASRLIRDRRLATRDSLLHKLYGPGTFPAKLATAHAFVATTEFVDSNEVAMLALEQVAVFFREKLVSQAALAKLAAEFKAEFPLLAELLQRVPPAGLVESVNTMTARLWDSFYALTIIGCDRYVSTNYLADGLRVYHVFRLLWMSLKLELANWAGVTFDQYDTLIDLEAAQAAQPNPDAGGKTPTLPTRKDYKTLETLTGRLNQIDEASRHVERLFDAQATEPVVGKALGRVRFTPEAGKVLAALPAMHALDPATQGVADIRKRLRLDRELVSLERERVLSDLVDPGAGHAVQEIASRMLAVNKGKVPAAASLSGLAGPGSTFHVPLSVGAIKPPVVGDLLIVEQELRRYEDRDVADVESIMRGERRERTIRKLNRTSQTTTTESTFEQEESTSLKTDERFQLSSQAQQTAQQGFGIEAGVSVSGKYGPVQVSASVNASFDTSKSSSEATAQEYAKTVTEEATKRIKNSIKESSSITILTETQDTVLRGFNNEAGKAHINGIYRWLDKIYEAQLVNYGRRLMLSLNVPEPAAFYRALIQQNEAEALADLKEPLHPSRIGRGTVTPLPESNTTGGFLSYQDLTEDNYAELAAYYDVAVQPPPPEYLTDSKAFAYPEAMQAGEIEVHDAKNDLSYVAADNTLTLDPAYRLTQVAVHAPVGANGQFGSYVDALKLGEVAPPSRPADGTTVAEANLILVQVANKSFYMSVRRDPDDPDKKVIETNFNHFQPIGEDWEAFGELVQPAIPITITSKFEGIFTFTVSYMAYRLDETFDAWKSATFAAILKGYTSKKQAYDQALAVALSKAQASTQARTFQLRDDQYRSIELTELKRGCIELLSAGTATGYTSIAVAEDGTPDIVQDPAEGALLDRWRSPLANGSVADFFEQAFDWALMTYKLYPYYWAGEERWKELAQASSADPVFEQFLRAGNASVVVPVRPGFERPVIFFGKTGLIWGGGYLSLFTSPDMLDAYADVEKGRQFDPPLEIGEPWTIRVPTSMVMLQQSDQLPEFPPEQTAETPPAPEEPVPDESVPF